MPPLLKKVVSYVNCDHMPRVWLMTSRMTNIARTAARHHKLSLSLSRLSCVMRQCIQQWDSVPLPRLRDHILIDMPLFNNIAIELCNGMFDR